MTSAIYGFSESATQAAALAQTLGIACDAIAVRQFPDGESLVRVPERTAPVAIVYRSLDRPNDKLVELMLAAAALRAGGARQVVLVAPYMAYMRQDMAFNPGEAVSQQIVGRFVAAHFDALVTVDPHLHRTPTLDAIVPGRQGVAVSAAGTLADMLRADVPPDAILVGPDSESRPWVESLAQPLGLDVMIGVKERLGDRDVALTLPGIARVCGRPVVLVDDMISSGGTLLNCAAQLQGAGARGIEAVTTHCLASDADLARLLAGGITRVRATDTVPGPVAVASIAGALASALRVLLVDAL